MVGYPVIRGWTGSGYVRMSVLWGYTDRYVEYEEGIDVTVGDHNLTFSTVPAGEVWVIEAFTAYSAQTDVDLVFLRAHCGSDDVDLLVRGYTTGFETVEIPGRVVLKADDYLWARFQGCSVANDIYASANGYKMAVE